MVRLQLDQWQRQKIEAVLGEKRGAGRPGRDDRNFVEALLGRGAQAFPWRDLPGDFGLWKTVFNRSERWASEGIWLQLFETLRQENDDEWHSIDSTINRLQGQLVDIQSFVSQLQPPLSARPLTPLRFSGTDTVTDENSGTGQSF